jgi:hypothetical protein
LGLVAVVVLESRALDEARTDRDNARTELQVTRTEVESANRRLDSARQILRKHPEEVLRQRKRRLARKGLVDVPRFTDRLSVARRELREAGLKVAIVGPERGQVDPRVCQRDPVGAVKRGSTITLQTEAYTKQFPCH